MKKRIKKLMVDIVEHFAGQTVDDVINTVKGGLRKPYDGDLRQDLSDMLVEGTLELDDQLHVRLSAEAKSLSEKIADQAGLTEAISELQVKAEQAWKDSDMPSSMRIAEYVRWDGPPHKRPLIESIKNGTVEIKGKDVRLDPYSHRPAPSNRVHDAQIYFEGQTHNFRGYAKYVSQVGVNNAVHPYEWMVAGWWARSPDDLKTNDNQTLAQMRRDKANLYNVKPEDLFGEYWRNDGQEKP